MYQIFAFAILSVNAEQQRRTNTFPLVFMLQFTKRFNVWSDDSHTPANVDCACMSSGDKLCHWKRCAFFWKPIAFSFVSFHFCQDVFFSLFKTAVLKAIRKSNFRVMAFEQTDKILMYAWQRCSRCSFSATHFISSFGHIGFVYTYCDWWSSVLTEKGRGKTRKCFANNKQTTTIHTNYSQSNCTRDKLLLCCWWFAFSLSLSLSEEKKIILQNVCPHSRMKMS